MVYAGTALRGYGKLIILKHNDDYLSAYAHNDELRVKEETPSRAERLSPIWVARMRRMCACTLKTVQRQVDQPDGLFAKALTQRAESYSGVGQEIS